MYASSVNHKHYVCISSVCHRERPMRVFSMRRRVCVLCATRVCSVCHREQYMFA